MFVSFKFAAATTLTSIALIGAAGAASAQDFQSNGRTTQVYHGDLDLSKPEHQAQLRSRIARAANRVCSSIDLVAMASCKKQTIAHVDTPVNAAIARADTGEHYASAADSRKRPALNAN